MNEKITVLNTANQPTGPFSLDEIRQRLTTGEFHRTQLAHVEGLGAWTPLSEVLDFIAKKEQAASLQSALRPATPAPAPAPSPYSPPATFSAPAPTPYSPPVTFSAPAPAPSAYSPPATFNAPAAPSGYSPPATFNAPAPAPIAYSPPATFNAPAPAPSAYGPPSTFNAPASFNAPVAGFSGPTPDFSSGLGGVRGIPGAGAAAPLPAYVSATGLPYAEFHLRAIASLIDSTLFYIVQAICMIPVGICYFVFFSHGQSFQSDNPQPFQSPPFINILSFGIGVLLIWLYYGLMESSSAQATLGKQIVGIRVTDLQGNQLSFGQASGRAFGRVINSMTCCLGYIGYLLPLMTEQRQALHDLFAGTIVVASPKTPGVN